MSSRPLETNERHIPELFRRARFFVQARESFDAKIAPEELFIRLLRTERKRAERSRDPFLLMLLDISQFGEIEKEKTVEILRNALRDTDITGWYEAAHLLGVIFTEIRPTQPLDVQQAIFARLTAALQTYFSPKRLQELHMSFHIFPEAWSGEIPQGPVPPELYRDSSPLTRSRRTSLVVKRAMDIAGSVAALFLLAPIFLIVAVAIKLTSEGPVFFRQERVGQFGKTFLCLKFRSMSRDSDPAVHQQYVSHFIAGEPEASRSTDVASPVYKLTDDTRITLLGKFLRKSSLDELPQFWNVLGGEMSLVGPRPPIPYELKAYQVWHRRRVLEAKPGLTGLWQVTGRNKTRFDDMVRLDLRYARTQSVWMDIKIILRTPLAILLGNCGY